METIRMTRELLVVMVVFITAMLYFGRKIGSKLNDQAFEKE
jgi:uncharacterized membrane protein